MPPSAPWPHSAPTISTRARWRPHIATMTTLLDTLRSLELNAYITFFDAVLGRLLIAAGQPEQARARLDTGLQLADDTGMCFYDAELLRLRAHTHTDPDARRADIDAALELARRQGATLFELRAALDDFELRGQPARAALADAVGRIPADSALPELARARAILDQVALWLRVTMLRRGLPRRYYSRPVDQTAQHSVQEALHFSCAGGVSRPHQRRRRRFTDAMVVKTAELASVAEEFERIGDLVAAVDSTAHAALAYRSQELRGSCVDMLDTRRCIS